MKEKGEKEREPSLTHSTATLVRHFEQTYSLGENRVERIGDRIEETESKGESVRRDRENLGGFSGFVSEIKV